MSMFPNSDNLKIIFAELHYLLSSNFGVQLMSLVLQIPERVLILLLIFFLFSFKFQDRDDDSIVNIACSNSLYPPSNPMKQVLLVPFVLQTRKQT